MENPLAGENSIIVDNSMVIEDTFSEVPGTSKSTESNSRVIENNNGSSIQTLEDGYKNSNSSHQEPQETNFLLAKEYFDDALSNRHIDFQPTSYCVKLYSCYKRKDLIFLCYFFYLVNVSLALFEKPNVPSIGLPYWVTTIIEFVCLSFFIFRFCHELLFTDFKTFWKDTKHIMYASILLLTAIDILTYTIIVEVTGDQNHPAAVRWTRPLRPFLIVNFPESRQIRRAYRNIRNTIPDIFYVVVLLFSSVALFSLMAVKLFSSKNLSKISGAPYFTDYFDSFWDLYVLITTANSPDISMPAYDSERWYMIFFVLFTIVNLYMFMAVFLAVVYNGYKANLKNEVQDSVLLKRSLLNKVYDLIKTRKQDGESYIYKETFVSILQAARPKMSQNYCESLWMVLDFDDNDYIDRKEFMRVVDIIDFKVTDLENNRTLAEKWIPSVYNSPQSKFVIKCVKHVVFRYVFDVIIFVNIFCIAFDWEGGEWAFLVFFSIEIIVKLYAFGAKAFFEKLWNIFDFTVVGAAILISSYEAIVHNPLGSGMALDILMVLRVVRIFRIFHSMPRFRLVINTIGHILPSMATYGGVILIFYYFFAIIGMECFSGKFRYTGYGNDVKIEDQYCGNYLLKNTTFYYDHYCSNNFNNILTSFVTLFDLMVVNQWHVITQGHVLVTNKAARFFFFSFHFLCVLIILNIFTAFVIEAFLLEFSFRSNERPVSPLVNRINQMGLGYGSKPIKMKKPNSTTEDQEQLVVEEEDEDSDILDADHETLQITPQMSQLSEQDNIRVISGKTSLRFHLKKRNKTVQGLLEKMFENELKEDDN